MEAAAAESSDDEEIFYQLVATRRLISDKTRADASKKEATDGTNIDSELEVKAGGARSSINQSSSVVSAAAFPRHLSVGVSDDFLTPEYRTLHPVSAPSISISRKGLFTLHIFFGGFESEQASPFVGALSQFRNIQVKLVYVKDIKDHLWSPKQLVDWLMQADAHFIPCHPHQGVFEQLRWNCTELALELQRLRSHRGFPTGDQLQCPIFLQDKFEYIHPLDRWSIPTAKIALVPEVFEAPGVAYRLAEFVALSHSVLAPYLQISCG